MIGRTALRGNYLPLLLTLCLAFLWWGWSRRSWTCVVLAGVCAGLLPYTYIAAPLCSATLPALRAELSPPPERKRLEETSSPLVDGLFPTCPRMNRAGEPPTFFPREQIWQGREFSAAVAALVAAPIAVYFALNPEQFTGRSSHLWVFGLMQGQGDPLGALFRNVWTHLLVFGFRGDPIWRYNLSGRPLLELWEAFFSGSVSGRRYGAGGGRPTVCSFSGWFCCSCRRSWLEGWCPTHYA